MRFNTMGTPVLEDTNKETTETGASDGMRTFFAIWAGHFVSVIGNALTTFGIGVWIFQKTGSATSFSLLFLAYSLPAVVVSPIAGALVDRWSRRRALLVSEAGAGLSSLLLATLVLMGKLQLWHIYTLVTIGATFATLSWPAVSAVISLLVAKRNLARANSMIGFNDAVANILGPVIGGAVIVAGGLGGLVMADVASFIVSIAVLMVIRIPAPPRSEGEHHDHTFWRDVAYGWHYIRERAGLRGLLSFFMLTNFLGSFAYGLFTPLLLTFYRADLVGRISGCAGLGMISGTIVMATWGGFKKRVRGIMLAGTGSAIALMCMVLPPNPILFGALIFLAVFWGPIGGTSSQAIWQSKVAPDVQGRVFAIRRMIAAGMTPLSFMLAGPLADKVFTPGMMPGGALAGTFGLLIGTGEGAGIRLIFLLAGAGSMITAVVLMLNPHVRRVETELPDFSREAQA